MSDLMCALHPDEPALALVVSIALLDVSEEAQQTITIPMCDECHRDFTTGFGSMTHHALREP